MPSPSRHAFSLVEIAIVLVVIGLLSGGILVGQGFVANSKMKSVTVDMQQFSSATQQFITQYNALPGDMATATRIWGVAGGSTGFDSTCFDTFSTDAKTCNGNGDRIIGMGSAVDIHERFRFWQHLTNAGFLDRQFTGRPVTSGTNQTELGVNVPDSKYKDSGYSSISERTPSLLTTVYFNTIAPDNILLFGKQIGGTDTIGPVLTPEQAYEMDTKMDDGIPGYGLLQVNRQGGGVAPNCATTADANSAAYDLARDSIECNLIYFLGRKV